METQKGYEFENQVELVLRKLEKKFPDRVKVTPQRDFSNVSRPHRVDFELEYKLGGLTQQHLVECQNRDRSSYDVADKIYAVRGTSDRNRYIFVYKDRDYLSEPVAKRLKDMGVLCFDFEGFKAWCIQLEADIALHQLGLEVNSDPELIKMIRDGMRTGKLEKPFDLPKLRDSGAKYDYSRPNPPDRAMTSGR
jgi:hypothetical protein